MKGEMASEEETAYAASVMATLNRYARDKVVDLQVHACTDVTGFGLAGHALEMAKGSGKTLCISPVSYTHLVCQIYHENTREYCLLKTEQFGTITMMEVGAMMVGKITNLKPCLLYTSYSLWWPGKKEESFPDLVFSSAKNWKGVRIVKKYRKLACILAGSMTMSLFAGCIGNGDVVPEEKNESTDTEEPTVSETSQEIKKAESRDIDQVHLRDKDSLYENDDDTSVDVYKRQVIS